MTETPPTLFDEPWHGTLNGYNHKKCRCVKCTEARRIYSKSRRKQNKKQISGDESWHGTTVGYSYHECRCGDCRAAVLRSRRSLRERMRQKDIDGDEFWHGTMYGYGYMKCRCADCCFSKKIYFASNKYGISKDKVRQLLSINKCEICSTESPKGNGWFFDHDHSCCDGKKACGECVRGLLCTKCNTIIGFANDDPEILKAAISYLERYSA